MEATYQGRKVYYEMKGEGAPVVLLHGYLESIKIWEGFSNDLAKNYRVICIDLPGHGNSETIAEVQTMDLLAGAVKEVLIKEKIKKSVIVGHSLGGYVTLSFVEKFPELLAGFCLFHSHPLADTEEVKENRKREIALVKAGKKHLIYEVSVPKAFAKENADRLQQEVSRAIDIARSTPDAGIIAMLHGMMQRPDRRKILEKPRLPGLWILGKKDQYIPYIKILSRVSPADGIQVTSLENSGHMGFIEEKEKSLRVLNDFLDTLQPFEA